MDINFDEIIRICKVGKFKDIAKSGSSKCFEIDSDYVVVPHKQKDVEYEDRICEIMQKLSEEEKKNIYSIVDYRIIDGVAWELQRRAQGEHFRTDKTKQSIIECIKSAEAKKEKLIKKGNLLGVKMQEKLIREKKEYMNTDEYQSLFDSRSNELMQRYNLIINMPKEHIIDFFRTILVFQENQLEYDTSGNNLLYDEISGFSFIDLDDISRSFSPNSNMDELLDANNYQTMCQLLGTDKINGSGDDNFVYEEDMPYVISVMREALKKIVSSVMDLEYKGKRLSLDTIQRNLETYKQFGIDISMDEIIEYKQRMETNAQNLSTASINTQGTQEQSQNTEFLAQKIGKATIQIPTANKDRAQSRIHEKQQRQHQEKEVEE